MRATHLLTCTLFLVVTACGGGGMTGDDVGVGDDGDPIEHDICGFDSDRYLPFEVGLTWTYQVTDLESGARKVKDQSIDEEIDDPTYGPVLVQTTGKLAGSTRSLLQVDGDRVVRYLQEDIDDLGVVERTTTYDPGQIRIDERRLEVGATWVEAYDETESKPGEAAETVPTSDSWEVLGVDVACTSPLGTFECLHLRRSRTAGGVAVKEFYFARGVGKIKETGDNVTEELTACTR